MASESKNPMTVGWFVWWLLIIVFFGIFLLGLSFAWRTDDVVVECEALEQNCQHSDAE